MLRSLMPRAILLTLAAACLGVAPRTTVAGPSLPRAYVLESGEWLWVPALKADGTDALGSITAVAATGSSIKGGGRVVPLVLPVGDHMLGGILYPLCDVGGKNPPFRPGDRVTATFPAGAATVAGQPTDAAADVPVAFLTDAEFCHPIRPPGERTLRAGYNVCGVRQEWFSVYLADRSIACDVWAGDGVALDSHFELTANPNGTAARTVLYQPSGDRGMSPRGAYLCPDGVFRFEFDADPGAYDAAAQKVVGLANAQGGRSTVGPAKVTRIGPSRWRVEQDVRRPDDPTALWTQGLQFRVPVPGLVVSGWKWFDPLTPVGYTGTAHPEDVRRYKGRVAQTRPMDTFGTNFSPASKPGDYATPDDRATPVSGATEAGFRIATAGVVSLDPVDLADPRFAEWSAPDGYAGWYLATLDRDPAAAGFADGATIQWDRAATYPSSVGGTLYPYLNTFAFAVGGNRLLVKCAHVAEPNPYDASKGVRATLAAAQAPAGLTVYVRKNHLLPPETYFDYCNDVGCEPGIVFAHAGTDDYVRWMIRLAIARTPDGRKIHGEYSNEHWNAGFNQYGYLALMAARGNRLHEQDPKANPQTYPSGTHWYTHRALRDRALCREELAAAGRDPDLFVMRFGSATQAPGVTDNVLAQVLAEGEVLDRRDRLAIEAYQDSTSPGGSWFGPDVRATWSRLSDEGRLDLFFAATFHGARKPWVDAHRAKLDAAGFRECGIAAYEGGPAYADPANDPATVVRMMASPRMYRWTASFLSLLQDAGISEYDEELDRYTYALGGEAAWTASTAPFQRPGTGDPKENPDPTDYPNVVSQRLGGLGDWNAGVDFDKSVPAPVDPAARPPTTGAVIAALKSATSAQLDAVAAAAAAGNRSVAAATSAAAKAVLDLADVLVRYLSGPTPAATPAP